MTDWKKLCDGCGKCCGCVPLKPKKYAKYKHLSQRKHELLPFIKNTILPVTDNFSCIFLNKNKRCEIYDARPNVCRLQGNTTKLPCPKIHNKDIIEAKGKEIDNILERFK